MNASAHDRPVAYEDYLRIEEETGLRHEYVGGWLYAMVGASRRHNRITGNIYAALLAPADNAGCAVYQTDVKLQTAVGSTYYPDLLVTCDPDDADPLVVTRPCLIVEVLSPSTSRIDTQEKQTAYRQVPSVLAYVIIDQDQRLVVRHWRASADIQDWNTELNTTGLIPLPCPDIALSFDTIYAGLSNG
jgi:Uma2 family endonuclease